MMVMLPPDQWTIRPLGDGIHLAITVRTNGGYFWTDKILASDFADDDASDDNPKRVVVDGIDGSPV